MDTTAITVIMETESGLRVVRATGYVYGDIALARNRLHLRSWMLVHLPSGAPLCFMSTQALGRKALNKLKREVRDLQSLTTYYKAAQPVLEILLSRRIISSYPDYLPEVMRDIESMRMREELKTYA